MIQRSDNMTKTIVTGNFKGGVGKTTNAVMIAYTLAKQGKKTLLVDLDPQANATDLLFLTMKNVLGVEPTFKSTLEVALEKGDLKPALVDVMDNLQLLPSYEDLQSFEKYLFTTFDDDYSQDSYFSKLLDKIKDEFEYVILDVPPQLNKYTDSALVACDYVIIILQTQQRSLTGAKTYTEHLLQIKEDYGLNLELLGVLPVLLQNGNELDLDILSDALEFFGKPNMFEIQIKQMARLKRFDRTGITDSHRVIHDRRVHAIYFEVIKEIQTRINIFENAKE